MANLDLVRGNAARTYPFFSMEGRSQSPKFVHDSLVDLFPILTLLIDLDVINIIFEEIIVDLNVVNNGFGWDRSDEAREKWLCGT